MTGGKQDNLDRSIVQFRKDNCPYLTQCCWLGHKASKQTKEGASKNDLVGTNFIYFFKAHQDQNRSYKEVCAPVIERCHFLFNELRPAIGNEVNTMSRSKLLKSTSRWKWAIAKVVENNKSAKCECKWVCSRYMMMQFKKSDLSHFGLNCCQYTPWKSQTEISIYWNVQLQDKNIRSRHS